MRNAIRMPPWGWFFLAAALPLGAGVGGCRRALPGGTAGSGGGMVGIVGTGGGGPGAGGNAGPGAGGSGGPGAGGAPAACAGASDARLVVASQRVLRLTVNETLNTVRSLFGDAEAQALVGIIGGGDDSRDVNRAFPPLQNNSIDGGSFPQVDAIAEHVAGYVLANFAGVTSCSIATDACATSYLGKLAGNAYRRQLTPDEKTQFEALYSKLRAPQIVNGYEVTFTIQEATSYAVNALLLSPQMLWRWELGDPTKASTSPAGVPLTDQELATHLAFFLTDQPPDVELLLAANAGTLRANLAAHVDTLLASRAAREWLRKIMETYFQLNKLPTVTIDTAKFPLFSPALVADMSFEARMFLDNALWNGNLTDLLTSRTAFLNTGSLARDIYMVLEPPLATATNFVQTTLPADERSGMLTNAALLTSRGTTDGRGLVGPRGLFVAAALLCMSSAPADDVDGYGRALGNYDTLGRYRTVDELGVPIDAHVTLPAALGGDAIANGVELAQKLAAKPAFTNCMANALLRYAMVDPTAAVEVPLPPQQVGCATADVVQRYQAGNGKTFTDLVRATVAAPAFTLRRAAP
jgi:hypothetical protein